MSQNKPAQRYTLVPCGVPGAIHAYYDVVDLQAGADHVLAYRVRHKPAIEIVEALNAHKQPRKKPQVAQIE